MVKSEAKKRGMFFLQTIKYKNSNKAGYIDQCSAGCSALQCSTYMSVVGDVVQSACTVVGNVILLTLSLCSTVFFSASDTIGSKTTTAVASVVLDEKTASPLFLVSKHSPLS